MMRALLFLLLSSLAVSATAQVVTSSPVSITSIKFGVSSANGNQYGALVTVSETPFLCQEMGYENVIDSTKRTVPYSNKVFYPASSGTFQQISAFLVTAEALTKKVKIVFDGCNASNIANGVGIKLQST